MKSLWIGLTGFLFAAQAFGLTGRYSATVIPVDLDKQVVQGWMPNGVTLTEPDAETHKVFILTGTQYNVVAFPPYKEVIVLVPNVSFQGKTYMYMPRLFLDNHGAIAGGRAGWGFPKIYGLMKETNESFELYEDNSGDNQLLSVQHTFGSEDVDRNSDNFKSTVALMSQPMLLNKGGRILCSEFLMNLNETPLSPATVEIDIMDGFMAGLGDASMSIANINDSAFGAFRMTKSFWRVPSTGRTCR